MRDFLLRIEPVIWVLFGNGLMIGTMLLTPWILIVGLAIPLGIVPADALSFDRAYELASNPIARLVLFALIALPLWKGAHHTRHLLIQFGGLERDGAMGSLLYALAAGGSIAAILAVIRL